jgi:cellulose synthase/poly-beta-1,6-N-acetylglucosamine synthase-like glycosyltransferase
VGWASRDVWFLIAFYSVVALSLTYIDLSGVFWRSFKHLPPAKGRIIAIVPAYNEEPELLHAAVRSLTNQTILPDEIHVMDDGSEFPVEPFDHPLVTWHYQVNQGKRHAQANILKKFSPNAWDFILTVDSDSVCDPDALEHLLRSMSDSRVQASTGMILVRNWRKNFLTRLTDINVVTSCLLFRMARSWLGVVTPTSGALAIYRADLVYDNLDDYVTSGTAGDDRRLSFYALLRGQVVGVPEAVVETKLPETWGGIFNQRMRWSKSAWLGIPFVLTNIRLLALVFYMYPLIFALMWPFVFGVLLKIWADYGTPTVLYGFLFWMVVAVTQTAIYAMYRPSFTARDRWTQWLLSPLYPILGIVILRPAAYWALTKLRSTSWHTRGKQEPASPRRQEAPDPIPVYDQWSASGTRPLLLRKDLRKLIDK